MHLVGMAHPEGVQNVLVFSEKRWLTSFSRTTGNCGVPSAMANDFRAFR